MDYDALARLRERDPGGELLRADTAPMATAFLHRVFVERNLRSVPSERLTELRDDELYALKERLGERKFPEAPKAHIDDRSHGDHGWLRKFHPEAGDQPHVELPPAAERALRRVESSHQTRGFIGTSSRLTSIVDLLRELVHGADEDPRTKLARLERERIELDRRIERARAGRIEPFDEDADTSALFARSRVDRRALASNVAAMPRTEQQVGLNAVVERLGPAELVAYPSSRDFRFEVVLDPARLTETSWTEEEPRRAVGLPVVAFSRSRSRNRLALAETWTVSGDWYFCFLLLPEPESREPVEGADTEVRSAVIDHFADTIVPMAVGRAR
jgi:hypothetical protein